MKIKNKSSIGSILIIIFGMWMLALSDDRSIVLTSIALTIICAAVVYTLFGKYLDLIEYDSPKCSLIQDYILKEFSDRISRKNSQIVLTNKINIDWLASSTFFQGDKRSFSKQHPKLDVALLDSISHDEMLVVLECTEHVAYFEVSRRLAKKSQFVGKAIKLEDMEDENYDIMDCTLELPMKSPSEH